MLALGQDPGTSGIGLSLLRRDGQRWSLVEAPVLKSLDELAAAYDRFSEYQIESVSTEDLSWTGAAGMAEGYGSNDQKEAVGMARLFAAMIEAPFTKVRPQTWQSRFGIRAPTRGLRAKQIHRACRMIVAGIPKVFSVHRACACLIAIAGAGGVKGRRK